MQTECSQCDFKVRSDSKHPVNSLRTHVRHKHEGFPENVARIDQQKLDARTRRCEREFLALYEATGSFHSTLEYHLRLIDWPLIPHNSQLRALVSTYEDAVEAGQPEAAQRLVTRMDRRLTALRKGKVYKTVETFSDAGIELATQIKGGDLDHTKQVTVKYIADGIAMMLREIGPAFGQPKTAPTQVNQININAGPPPPKRVKAGEPADIIEAEVRELVDGS